MTTTTLDAPRFNEPLAREVLAKIAEDADHWNQFHWVSACGTSFCFAGWTLVLSGYTPVAVNDEYFSSRMVAPDGQHVNVGDEAERLLGLNEYDGEDLFSATNTYGDLVHQVDALAKEHK